MLVPFLILPLLSLSLPQALGEACGGPWGIYGDCGVGLECHQEPCSPDTEDSECYLYYLTGQSCPRFTLF